MPGFKWGLDDARAGPRDAGRRQIAPEVHVGFDFGTSQSKAVVYWEAARRREVVGWPDAPTPATSFLLPSVVARDGESLRFGFDADRVNPDAAARSFKVCIGCELGMKACPRCSRRPGTPGQVALGSDGRGEFRASELATLYVAFALAEIDRWIGAHPVIASGDRRTMNSAAPLDQLQHHLLQRAFELVLHRAIYLRRRVPDSLAIGDARRLLEEAATAVPQPRPAAEAQAFIVPEACAATHTVVCAPGGKRRRYAVLDIGAGSTDVGVFWCYEKDGAPTWDFYASTSAFVAGDAMDRALLQGLAARFGLQVNDFNLRSLRSMKPDATGDGIDCGTMRLSGEDYAGLLNPVTSEIYSTYRRTWGRAQRSFAPRAQDWPDLDIVLSGGGSRCWPLHHRLRDQPMQGFCREIEVQRVALPTGLTWADDVPAPTRAAAADLLAVAVGLSYPPAELPQFEQETESLPRPKTEPDIILDNPHER